MEQLLCHKTWVKSVLVIWVLFLGLGAVGALAAPEVTGDWDFKMTFGEREVTAKLSISRNADGTYQGTWTTARGQSKLSDVKYDQGKLTFTRKTTFGDQEFKSTFEGTITDDTLKGLIKSERGETTANGKRSGPDIAGKWELTTTSDRGTRTTMLTIKQDMTGTYQSRNQDVAIKDLKLEGDKLSFKVERGSGEQTFMMEFKGQVEGQTLTGEFITQRGSSKVAGKKVTDESGAPGSGRRPGREGDRRQLSPQEKEKAVKALNELIDKVKADKEIASDKIEEAAAIVSDAAQGLEPNELLEKMKTLQQYSKDSAIPMRDKALGGDKQLDREILRAQINAFKKVSPEKVEAHRAAEGFPGLVSAQAKRITQQVAIITDRPGWHNSGIYGNPENPYWHSTGLYAAPGEVITVSVDESVLDKGLYVRIGCHSDQLWRASSWSRAPDICTRYPITQSVTQAANAFGGLVYIETPSELTMPEFTATIAGAVAAPYYVHGKTDIKQWQEVVRKYPAPWAELQSEKLILTIPAQDVRNLDDPAAVMDFWDRIMDLYAELLGRSAPRRRIERFVSDVQISAGYMHSGYPLMVGLDITGTMIDTERIKANGHSGVWGLFHEIGHNHQNRDWTFGGTTEVTVNLFSLYIMDKVCGLYLDGHPSVQKQVREAKIKKYFEEGRDFNKWKSDPFLGLVMYIQMIEEFGWEPFIQVFAEYRGLTDQQRPRDDEQRRNQWMVRFSRTVKRNLGPFFEAWAIPTSPEARASIADLPAWLPENLPVPTQVLSTSRTSDWDPCSANSVLRYRMYGGLFINTGKTRPKNKSC